MTPEELTTVVAKFIVNRFPAGLEEKMLVIMSEVVLDALVLGAEIADREAMRQDIMVAPRQIIINP
jgi:hypothetical protein